MTRLDGFFGGWKASEIDPSQHSSLSAGRQG
ncbi:MAG: hypothetical protein DMG30_18665 [Acidobacteria bacterium]|nr:MAG: hypothetical protein DMG30_18665 [Acidobacteriota bacterium]